MAGFEFCPSCSHRYAGFMPEFRPFQFCGADGFGLLRRKQPRRNHPIVSIPQTG